MTMTTPQPAPDWQGWLRRWDAQQTGYIPDREERFTAILRAIPLSVHHQFSKEIPMATTQHPATTHHQQAAEHYKNAAAHHERAAAHHAKGEHTQAAEQAHYAQGHAAYATQHAEEAAKSHLTDASTKQ